MTSAAVLTGMSFERKLRRLWAQNNSSAPAEADKTKRLGAPIDELKKANIFNEAKAKQLRSWAEIRNHAAHGKTRSVQRYRCETHGRRSERLSGRTKLTYGRTSWLHAERIGLASCADLEEGSWERAKRWKQWRDRSIESPTNGFELRILTCSGTRSFQPRAK